VSRARFWEQFEERMRALPGVAGVALTSDLPIGGSPVFHNLAFEGKPAAPGTEPEVYYRSVNDGFFSAMGIPVLKGRAFTPRDREGAPLVAVVNEAFTSAYYPAEDVLGKRIRWASGDGTWITIVGVAADVRGLSLDQAEVPAVHMPIAQEVNPWRRWMDIAVRTRGGAPALAAALRRELSNVDRTVPVARVRLMSDVVAESVADRRFSLVLLGGFALVSLVLAAAGTYAVIANLVAQRTREVGVRMALGATPADIFRLIVRKGIALAAAGVLIGLAAAAASTRLLDAMLFGVSRFDLATFAVATFVLLLAAAAASYWPARRAALTDPLLAMRSE
jgi:predicted permease